MSADLPRPILSAQNPSTLACEEELERFCEKAEQAWPELRQPRHRFLRDLNEKLAATAEGGTGPALAQLCPAELYLACGCRHGDPAALQAFDARYLLGTKGALLRLGLSEDQIREVYQFVRVKLLLPHHDGRPRIWDYAGSGKLEALVRVVALRTGVSQRRADAPKQFAADTEWLAFSGGDDGPDFRSMRQEHREAFKAALDWALTTLSKRERNILRLSAVDGLRVEQIAALYQVHRVTLSRLLARTRESLAERIRRRLREQLRLSKSDLESFWSFIDSQLELSLDRLLRSSPGQAPSSPR